MATDIYFKTTLKRGARGTKGNQGISFEVPTGAIIGYDGDGIPEGYIETETPQGFKTSTNEVPRIVNIAIPLCIDMGVSAYDPTVTPIE